MVRMIPPTLRAFVSSAWGASRAYRGGWHEGLDFPDTRGTPVIAAAAGTVVKSASTSGYAGRYIAIDHGDGLTSLYMHNAANIAKTGDRVRQGEQIGTVGGTGTKSGKPHVHFAVRATPAALSEYASRYGEPTTGFGREMSFGRGVPAEPFMSGATYGESAKAAAIAKGVTFYAGVSLVTVAVLGFVGWGLWKLLK
jgi:murein DD-endopeptidase MepM/ murein hydrolase activator NlpD